MEKQINVIAQLKDGTQIVGFTYGNIEVGEWHAVFTDDSGLNHKIAKIVKVK